MASEMQKRIDEFLEVLIPHTTSDNPQKRYTALLVRNMLPVIEEVIGEPDMDRFQAFSEGFANAVSIVMEGMATQVKEEYVLEYYSIVIADMMRTLEALHKIRHKKTFEGKFLLPVIAQIEFGRSPLPCNVYFSGSHAGHVVLDTQGNHKFVPNQVSGSGQDTIGVHFELTEARIREVVNKYLNNRKSESNGA